nr:MAG TPA: hypothetical protein [Caudoviricetes sp.]
MRPFAAEAQIERDEDYISYDNEVSNFVDYGV